MIEIKTKIHDAYSLEFKQSMRPRFPGKTSEFTVGMWFFVPGSLEINASTYPKERFYRDLKSNVRLITPSCPLCGIVSESVERVLRSEGTQEYEYELKLFAAMVKSALRDSKDLPDTEFSKCVSDICEAYFKFQRCEAHALCGEFICNACIRSALKRLENNSGCTELVNLVKQISSIREREGYATVDPSDAQGNNYFIYRQGVLKKYVEKTFYLKAPKKRDGIVAEQAYYSIAAGIAMLFATVVGWAFQRHFGNLTWPLFIALIISYMLKDRIKELMRYWFSHRVGSKYFDNKAHITFKGQKIGVYKEGMDFISYSKVPQEVIAQRDYNRTYDGDTRVPDEKVFLYRMNIKVDREINDIVRFHVGSLMHQMDNPTKMVKTLGADGTVQKIPCKKDYHLNIVLEFQQEGTVEFKHFRVYLSRSGIDRIEEIQQNSLA